MISAEIFAGALFDFFNHSAFCANLQGNGNEKREGIVLRLLILVLSMGSVISFSYALAGYGVKFLGRGEANLPYIFGGLAGGFACGALAIYLWKRWLKGEI